MNNRERNWYEGEYGKHPPNCNCATCVDARRRMREAKEQLTEEQANMRTGAEERARRLQSGGKKPKIDWSWLKNRRPKKGTK